jgi:hypothetical protein
VGTRAHAAIRDGEITVHDIGAGTYPAWAQVPGEPGIEAIGLNAPYGALPTT